MDSRLTALRVELVGCSESGGLQLKPFLIADLIGRYVVR